MKTVFTAGETNDVQNHFPHIFPHHQPFDRSIPTGAFDCFWSEVVPADKVAEDWVSISFPGSSALSRWRSPGNEVVVSCWSARISKCFALFGLVAIFSK